MERVFKLIMEIHCIKYGVSPEDILSHDRSQPLPMIRAKIIHDYKTKYPYTTWRQIGKWMDRDHSSIINLYNNIEFKKLYA